MKMAPSTKNPPEYLSRGAEHLWEYTLKHYADDIYEPKTLREQWAKAKGHFHRICSLKGVEPYNKYERAAAALERLARRL